jgi:hypothetical protein
MASPPHENRQNTTLLMSAPRTNTRAKTSV